jgi:hypothetical protein
VKHYIRGALEDRMGAVSKNPAYKVCLCGRRIAGKVSLCRHCAAGRVGDPSPLVKLALLMLMAVAAAGQSVTLSLSSSSMFQSGGAVTLTLTFADLFPTADMGGLQWVVSGTGVTAGTPTLGAASTAVPAAVQCGPVICIDTGAVDATPNDNPFASGVLMTIPLTVAPTAAGPLVISLTGVVASDITGEPIVVTIIPVTLTMVAAPTRMTGTAK